MTLAPAADVDGAGKTGVVVADIDPDGAAAQKGLQTGDVILEVAGKSVSRPVGSHGGDRRRQGGRQEVGADARQDRGQHALRRAARPKPSRKIETVGFWRGRPAIPLAERQILRQAGHRKPACRSSLSNWEDAGAIRQRGIRGRSSTPFYGKQMRVQQILKRSGEEGRACVVASHRLDCCSAVLHSPHMPSLGVS